MTTASTTVTHDALALAVAEALKIARRLGFPQPGAEAPRQPALPEEASAAQTRRVLKMDNDGDWIKRPR